MAEAETKDKVTEAPATPSAPARTQALAEMVNAANALQAIQAQAAIEAMRLPDRRLDDAGPDGGAPSYTLRDDGGGTFTKVDAFGNEVM